MKIERKDVETAARPEVDRDPRGGLSRRSFLGAGAALAGAVAALRPADLEKLDTAPVQVHFTTTTRHNVLAVPVTALVALHEGGYALQRTDGTLVAVTTGLFAGGQVEVSGNGVTAGMRVETAS